MSDNILVTEWNGNTGTLDNMLLFAEKFIGFQFERHGAIHPMFHAETDDKTYLFKTDMTDKDAVCMTLAAEFARLNVKRFVFIDEAWVLKIPEAEATDAAIAAIRRSGLSNHPQRSEMVMIHAQDAERLKTINFDIVRPQGQAPHLANRSIIEGGSCESRWAILLAHLRETRLQ